MLAAESEPPAKQIWLRVFFLCRRRPGALERKNSPICPTCSKNRRSKIRLQRVSGTLRYRDPREFSLLHQRSIIPALTICFLRREIWRICQTIRPASIKAVRPSSSTANRTRTASQVKRQSWTSPHAFGDEGPHWRDQRSPLLVHQVRDWFSGAAAYFGWMREAKRENTRCVLRPMSDKAASQKTRSPEGYDENGPAAALLARPSH